MSFTSTVPAAVPSVFQSSVPFTPSLAARTVICGGTPTGPPLPASLSPPAELQALRMNSRMVMQEIRMNSNRIEAGNTGCFFINPFQVSETYF
jgi:hypothetical protein